MIFFLPIRNIIGFSRIWVGLARANVPNDVVAVVEENAVGHATSSVALAGAHFHTTLIYTIMLYES